MSVISAELDGVVSRGIQACTINSSGHLIFTLTDNSTLDMGVIRGGDGADGTTFTPSVDTEGNISWTNDGGKENPTTRNIKGPTGSQGPEGTAGAITGVTAEVDNASGVPEVTVTLGGTGTARTFHLAFKNLKGTKGDTGDPGVSASTLTLTLPVSGWVDNVQTVSATGVTASSIVIIDPDNGNVECTAQGAGTLTFTASTTPTAAVTVKVVIL